MALKTHPIFEMRMNCLAVALCCGAVPGGPFWVWYWWNNGTCSEKCQYGMEAPCKLQLAEIVKVLAHASLIAIFAEGLFSIVFKRYGGKFCGSLGGALSALGWLMISAGGCSNLQFGMHLITIGAASMKWSVNSFLIYFHDSEGLVMWNKNAYYHGGFITVQTAMRFNPNNPALMMAVFGIAGCFLVQKFTPSDAELNSYAEKLRWPDGAVPPRSGLGNPVTSLMDGFKILCQPFTEEGADQSKPNKFKRQNWRIHYALLLLTAASFASWVPVLQLLSCGWVNAGVPIAPAARSVYGISGFCAAMFLPASMAFRCNVEPDSSLTKYYITFIILLYQFHPAFTGSVLSQNFLIWFTVCSQGVLACIPYVISRHIYAIAPQHMVGSVSAAIGIPILFIARLFVTNAMDGFEDDAIAGYCGFFTHLAVEPWTQGAYIQDLLCTGKLMASSFFFLFLLLVFNWKIAEVPKENFWLEKDIPAACMTFGCKDLQEVYDVMEIQSVVDAKNKDIWVDDFGTRKDTALSCLQCTSTEEHTTIIRQLNAEKLHEQLMNVDPQIFRQMVIKGLIWQKSFEREGLSARMGCGIFMHRTFWEWWKAPPFNHVAAMTAKREANNVYPTIPFPDAKFSLDVDTSEFVAVCFMLESEDTGKFILVQTSEKTKDGLTINPKVTYPKVKLFAGESVQSGYERVKTKVGLGNLEMTPEFEEVTSYTEKFSSTSYNGIKNSFRTRIVPVTLLQKDPEKLEGFDKEVYRTTLERNTITLEWLTETAIKSKNSAFKFKGKTPLPGNSHSVDPYPSSAWAEEVSALNRNLASRTNTKHLIRMLQKGDKAALQNWFKNQPQAVSDAIQDMFTWAGDDGHVLYEKVFQILTWEEMADLVPIARKFHKVLAGLLYFDLKMLQEQLSYVNGEYEQAIWKGELKNATKLVEPQRTLLTRRKARIIERHEFLTPG